MAELSWSEERLYFDPAQYFDELFAAIEAAKRQVIIEAYIVADDEIGNRLVERLIAARARGVEVFMLVDGVGSLNWIEECFDAVVECGVNVRVYHPLPWPLSNFFLGQKERYSFLKLLLGANSRDHRKVTLIDGCQLWVGSRNFTESHLNWRDLSICVEGSQVQEMERSFRRVWKAHFVPRFLSQEVTFVSHTLVRINETVRLRRALLKDLNHRIENGREVWISNPYFIPVRSFIQTLCKSARKGCEILLLFPSKSDVPMVKWITQLYYQPLLEAGIRIFEYQPRILHSKTIIIDEWAIVGTSNLNHRSFLSDLEVDVVVTHRSNLELMRAQFSLDLRDSKEIRVENLNRLPFWQLLLGKIFYFFRGWF